MDTSSEMKCQVGKARNTSNITASPTSATSNGRNIVKSPWGYFPVPHDVTITDLMLRRFSERPSKTAIIDNKIGKAYSYAELSTTICKLASGLTKYGLTVGSVVAVSAPNSLQMALLLLAVPATGACFTPMNNQLKKGDVDALMEQCQPQFLITTPQLLPNFASKVKTLKKVFTIGKVPGFKSIQELITEGDSDHLPDLKVDPISHLAIMPFSSGTTGLPKGVQLSHYNLVSSVLSNCWPAVEYITEDDVMVNVFPFAHIGGIVDSLLSMLYSLSTIILLEKYDFEQHLAAIQKYKATKMFAPPPVCVRLLNDPIVSKYDLHSVQTVISGAAPISEVLQNGLIEKLNLKAFRQCYGMTEVAGITHIDMKSEGKVGAVGFPVSNVMCKIINPDTGEELTPTSEGEVCTKGPSSMLGYLDNPEATARTKDRDGWIHTGDIGYHDSDGYLHITDRCKDLIKYKGYQVAPAELEGVLLGHPLVADAAITGVPDERAGEVPCAFVVLQRAVVDEEKAKQDIMKYVNDKVAVFKQIRGGIHIVDVIPKLASGKILRRILHEQCIKSRKSKL